MRLELWFPRAQSRSVETRSRAGLHRQFRPTTSSFVSSGCFGTNGVVLVGAARCGLLHRTRCALTWRAPLVVGQPRAVWVVTGLSGPSRLTQLPGWSPTTH